MKDNSLLSEFWNDRFLRMCIIVPIVVIPLFLAYEEYGFLVFPPKKFIFRDQDSSHIQYSCFDGRPPIVTLINNKKVTIHCHSERAAKGEAFECVQKIEYAKWNPSQISKKGEDKRFGLNTSWEAIIYCSYCSDCSVTGKGLFSLTPASF
jgi:hypothetical protein